MKTMHALRVIGLMTLAIVFAPAALAEEALPKTAEKFEVSGHTAFLYAAPKPAEGKSLEGRLAFV